MMRRALLLLIFCSYTATSFSASPLDIFKRSAEVPEQKLIEEYETKWEGPPKPYRIRALLHSIARMENRSLITAPELQRYAQGIADQLLRGFKGPAPKVEVLITAARGTTPMATADHKILLPAELIGSLQNESELAFVIAHELGHILMRDFKLEEDIDATKTIMTRMANASVMGATVASMRIEKKEVQGEVSFEVTDIDTDKIANAAADAVQTYFWMAELTDTVIGPSVKRKDEQRADMFAADLMIRNNFNLVLGTAAIDRVHVYRSSYLKEAMKLIKSQIADIFVGAPKYLVSNSNQVSFNAGAFRKNIDQTGKRAIKRLGLRVREMRRQTSPKDSDARTIFLNNYTSDQYTTAQARGNSQSGDGWERVQQIAGIYNGRVEKAHSVRKELGTGNLDVAVAFSEDMIKGDTRNDGYFRYSKYMLRQAQYQATGEKSFLNQAITNLELATNSKTSGPDIYAALAAEYASGGSLAKSMSTLDKAGDEFMHEAFWPLRINLLYRNGKSADACEIYTQCKESEIKGLRSQCRDQLQQAGALAVVDNGLVGATDTNIITNIVGMFSKPDLCVAAAEPG